VGQVQEKTIMKAISESRGSYERRDLPREIIRAFEELYKNAAIQIKRIVIRLANSCKSAKIGINIIDSGADKHLIVVSKGGAWIATEIYGPIKCEGFDNKITKLDLGIAETLAFTKEGKKVILEAKQAVIMNSEVANTLIDPSAMSASGGSIEIDFDASIGEYKYGCHKIALKPNKGGIGFYSRRPTEKERRDTERVIISTADYNKPKFMGKGLSVRSGIRKLKEKGKFIILYSSVRTTPI
jgi:hypothetical protein